MEIAISQVKTSIKQDPVTWCREIERFPHYFKILERFFDLYLKYPQVFPNQAKLAEIAGCSLSSTNRFIRKLKEWGLIVVQQRGHSQTALYHFSPDLQEPELRKQLSVFFKCFDYLSRSCMIKKILIVKQYISLDTCTSIKNLIKEYIGLGSSDRCAEPGTLQKGKVMNEDNYNYREAAPPRELKPRNQLQAPQKGDKQTFVGPLESLSYAQLQAELHKEFNKESFYTSNPKNLVGPDYRRVKALKAELARRDQQDKNDRGESIITTIYF